MPGLAVIILCAPVWQVDRAYKLLEAFQTGEVEGRQCIAKQIAEGLSWRESQELFELPVMEYNDLQKCQVGILVIHTALGGDARLCK